MAVVERVIEQDARGQRLPVKRQLLATAHLYHQQRLATTAPVYDPHVLYC